MKEKLIQLLSQSEFKRILAAWIDVHIVFFVNIIIYGLMVTVWRIGRNYFYDYIGSYSIGWTVFLYVVSYAVSMFLYYAFLEIVLGKKSVGKYIARYGSSMNTENRDSKKIVLHIWCRVVACFFYPITVLYFLFTGRMMYDTLLS